MKNWLLFACVLLLTAAFGQKSAFYQTENGEYAFQFDGTNCKLYELSRYSTEVSRESDLYPTHDYSTWSDSLGILFYNGHYAISYDYKYFRVLRLKNGKPKNRLAYVAKRVKDPSKIHEAINYTYWEELYRKTLEEAEADFPLFQEYYYQNRRASWNQIPFKQVAPQEFKLLAAERKQLLKDSIEKTNLKLILLNRTVAEQLDTMNAASLKQNYLDRPLGEPAYKGYTHEMLVLVAEKRPDLFLGLVEQLPERKEELFGETEFLKGPRKSIRAYETDSPVKKEFFRYHRREALKMGLIVTGSTALELGVIGGAVTGIVYLFRR